MHLPAAAGRRRRVVGPGLAIFSIAEDRDAADDQRPADDLGRAEHDVDLVLEQQPEHRRGQEREQDVAREAQALRPRA